MRPCDSVAGTRCTRCVPPSNLKTEYAPSPLIANVYLPSPMSSGSVLKPAPLGVLGEHPVQVAGPQPGLLAAGAALDLDDHVLVVVGVALDHREAELLLDALEVGSAVREHLAHLGVVGALGDQLARAVGVVLRAAPLLGQLRGRLEPPVLPADLGVPVAVPDHVGVGDLPRQLGEARLDLLDERLDHGPSSLATSFCPA